VLARRSATGEMVAIKYLAAELLTDPRHRARFRDEVNMLARVAHPHVARLHEYVETPEGAAIIMEAVNGVSLREVLRQNPPLPPEAALTVLKGSLRGLGAAHAPASSTGTTSPPTSLSRATGPASSSTSGSPDSPERER
jgi:serine/threonine protein kinase